MRFSPISRVINPFGLAVRKTPRSAFLPGGYRPVCVIRRAPPIAGTRTPAGAVGSQIGPKQGRDPPRTQRGIDVENRCLHDVFLSLLDRSLVSGPHPGTPGEARHGPGAELCQRRGPTEVASKPTIAPQLPSCPVPDRRGSSAPSGFRKSREIMPIECVYFQYFSGDGVDPDVFDDHWVAGALQPDLTGLGIPVFIGCRRDRRSHRGSWSRRHEDAFVIRPVGVHHLPGRDLLGPAAAHCRARPPHTGNCGNSSIPDA
jgi:hypothetical protein